LIGLVIDASKKLTLRFETNESYLAENSNTIATFQFQILVCFSSAKGKAFRSHLVSTDCLHYTLGYVASR